MFGLLKKRLHTPQNANANANTLSADQWDFWNTNGYLQLAGAVSPQELAQIQAQVDDQWAHKENNDHLVDVLSGEFAGREFRMSAIPASVRQDGYKLNNLFGRSAAVREVALNPTIKSALTELLAGEPLICNTLNFERGSQQPFHLDTWYMPPPVEGKMVAAIIALDDIGPDNGPFTYYPGSHAIAPYYFSHGRLNIINAEAEKCIQYINQGIEERGLSPTTLSCKAGDVFFWHANLFHGGAPINDMSLTRRSMVVHYWRECDMRAGQVRRDGDLAYLGHTLRGEISF